MPDPTKRGTRAALFMIGVGVGAFSTTLAHALWYAPELEVPQPAAAAAAPSRALTPGDEPARLAIPSLGIDASVQKLGINAEGAMAAPSDFSEVGWYEYGAVPGYTGTAVIAGHLDNGIGLDGVFKHLDQLAVGDTIIVEAANGTKIDFIVSSIHSYPYASVPDTSLFATTGPPRLALITCSGSLLYAQHTYDRRLVVIAALQQPS